MPNTSHSERRRVMVYRFGCHQPTDRHLAVQLLGQAYLYREALRRIYNDETRDRRALRQAGKDDAHAHVLSYFHLRKQAAIRAARAERGHLLDCGTYWLIEDAALQAAKASGLDPVKRRPWNGLGRIGAAIQSVQQFPADAWDHPRVSLTAPNDKGHAELTIRIGAFKDERALTWPIKLHRPFPPGAVVKQVAVQRTRCERYDGQARQGYRRDHWEALVTMTSERTADRKVRGAVGIDLGWRRRKAGGLRVAVHVGADGATGELAIDTLDAFDYANNVRAIRDTNFDTAKAFVQGEKLPGTEHAHLWRAKERMYRVADKTTDNVGPRWWARRDRHLRDIEDKARNKAVRRRLDAFRVYADQLAKRYRYLVLEDMPISDLIGETDEATRRQRSAASLSLLQTCLVERFGAGRVHWEPSKDSSRTCSECEFVCPEGIGAPLEWVCPSCGVVHDQDVNAATNLRVWGERWIDEGNPPRARSRKAKKRKEKKNADAIATGDGQRMVVTAREVGDKAAE